MSAAAKSFGHAGGWSSTSWEPSEFLEEQDRKGHQDSLVPVECPQPNLSDSDLGARHFHALQTRGERGELKIWRESAVISCAVFQVTVKKCGENKKYKPPHLSAFSLLQAVHHLLNSGQVAMETISMPTKIGRNYRFHPHIHHLISSKKEKWYKVADLSNKTVSPWGRKDPLQKGS